MPTVREIADLAGVSTSTVSLVLNNKPGVSPDMRRVVLNARDQLRHTKKSVTPLSVASASSKPPRNSFPLSIVVLHPPVLQSSYVFSEVMRGIQTAAQTYNLQLRLITNDPTTVVTERHVSHLYLNDPNLRPDGVIVFGAQRHEPLLDAAHSLNIPCVVLGRQASNYAVSGIGRDEQHHAYQLTHYLTELGHRAIGFLGGEQVYDYWHTRLLGYTQALQDVGVDVEEAWVRPGGGDSATHTLLRDAPEVTAVIYVNDTCAAAGLPLIAQAGLSIPRDLSVVSFDDTEIAREYDPPITSISYRRFEEGQWAVKMLVDQIQSPYLERVQAIFTAELIVRESCAPPTAR